MCKCKQETIQVSRFMNDDFRRSSLLPPLLLFTIAINESNDKSFLIDTAKCSWTWNKNENPKNNCREARSIITSLLFDDIVAKFCGHSRVRDNVKESVLQSVFLKKYVSLVTKHERVEGETCLLIISSRRFWWFKIFNMSIATRLENALIRNIILLAGALSAD